MQHSILDERTTVPVWSLLLAVPTFVGFVVWLSNVAYVTDANAKNVAEVRQDVKALYEIRADIRVIKQVLKIQDEQEK